MVWDKEEEFKVELEEIKGDKLYFKTNKVKLEKIKNFIKSLIEESIQISEIWKQLKMKDQEDVFLEFLEN